MVQEILSHHGHIDFVGLHPTIKQTFDAYLPWHAEGGRTGATIGRIRRSVLLDQPVTSNASLPCRPQFRIPDHHAGRWQGARAAPD